MILAPDINIQPYLLTYFQLLFPFMPMHAFSPCCVAFTVFSARSQLFVFSVNSDCL